MSKVNETITFIMDLGVDMDEWIDTKCFYIKYVDKLILWWRSGSCSRINHL